MSCHRWSYRALGAPVIIPRPKLYCSNCSVDRKAPVDPLHFSVCFKCGVRLVGDEVCSKSITHYTGNRRRIFQFLAKVNTPISLKRATWRDFPVGLFKLIKGSDGETTHKGGTACTQLTKTLVTAEQIGAFFAIDTPTKNSTTLKCVPQGVVSKRGTIKVIAPPITLKHKTMNEGTESMECELQVIYNVVIFSQSGVLKKSRDFPMDRKRWGVGKTAPFDPDTLLHYHTFRPAVALARLAHLDEQLSPLRKGEKMATRRFLDRDNSDDSDDTTHAARKRRYLKHQAMRPALRALRDGGKASGASMRPSPEPVSSSSDSEDSN